MSPNRPSFQQLEFVGGDEFVQWRIPEYKAKVEKPSFTTDIDWSSAFTRVYGEFLDPLPSEETLKGFVEKCPPPQYTYAFLKDGVYRMGVDPAYSGIEKLPAAPSWDHGYTYDVSGMAFSLSPAADAQTVEAARIQQAAASILETLSSADAASDASGDG